MCVCEKERERKRARDKESEQASGRSAATVIAAASIECREDNLKDFKGMNQKAKAKILP